MQIDKEKLKIALSVLYEEDHDAYYSGHFISLLHNVRSNAFKPATTLSTVINPHQLSKRLLLIHMELLNLATISIRLIMQQLLRDDKCEYKIDDNLWRYFASADIDLFFIKYRSVFDNIAQLIKTITSAAAPNSLNDLMTKAKPNTLPLDFKYVELILKCDWFKTIRTIRDSIEHHGAETNVDYNKDKVLFKISELDASYTHVPGKSLINIPEIVYDDFSDFELFAGIFMGYLIWFLEELSLIISQDLKSSQIVNDRIYHPGFSTVRTWIENAITERKSLT
ncbi:MAG: hypothetical protein WCA39_02780 [Nitrososphaeraceae archaeon]